MTAQSFIVRRNDFHDTRFVGDESMEAPLSTGSVRMRIDLFALTSNNITYAAFGNAMRYWDFFPCDVEGFGRIPVWGFADVIESAVDGVRAGERFYGYWPISSHAVVEPERVTGIAFVDGAPHRKDLPAVYNRYTRCSADPAYRHEHEAQIALLRPLFVTSFLIDDFLADNEFFGASTVLLSSASSKTAYGTAFCLSQRRGSSNPVKIIGITSRANMAYTRTLDCYDEVLPYEDITQLSPEARSIYVDFSGSAAVRAAIHDHFDLQLAYSCSVGGTHWNELGGGKGLPGPRPVLFFAPDQVKKRNADWGPAGFGERLAGAWNAFMGPVTDRQSPWLRVVRGQGAQDVERTYRALLAGSLPPAEGHVLRL